MRTPAEREKYINWIVPIHLDPEDHTMDKKLVVNVAPTGAFIKRRQNPHQAYTPEELAREVIASYKEGASVWHIHIRDAEGVPENDPEVVLRALDLVLDECPDILLSHTSHVDSTKKGADMLKPLVVPLLDRGAKRGRKYIHSVVIAPYSGRGYEMEEPLLKDIVTYLEGNDIRPEFQIHNYACINHVREWLLKDGTLKGPCVMNLINGFHGFDYSGPTGLDPWGRIYFMSLINLLPQGSVIGATIGGHSWLPLITEAITLGVDCVRIGMEDTIWMYPHKDEKIKSCAEVIRKVTTITRELGREIATPEDTKLLFGLHTPGGR